MSDDRNTHNGGGWQPHPQGEYDSDATAFVQLPEGMLDAPLAAPGHGYVPPQITVTPTTADATDPAATGAWVMPPEVTGAAHPEHQPAESHGYDPRATGQWSFTETYGQQGHDQQGHDQGHDPGHDQGYGQQYGQGGAAPSSDITGQWSIPVAEGDLPDESGEFTASSLTGGGGYPVSTQLNSWPGGGMPPATLPGGAPAPWATGAGAGAPWGAQAPEVEEEAAQEEPGESRFEQTTLLRAVRVPPAGQSGVEAAQAAQAAEAVEAAQETVEAAQEAVDALTAPEPPYEAAYEALHEAPGPVDVFGTPIDVSLTAEASVAPEVLGVPEAPEVPEVLEAPETPAEHAESAESAEPAESPESAAEPGEADEPEERGEPAEPVEESGVAGDADEAEAEATGADAPVIAPNPLHDDHPLGSYVLRVNGTDRPVTDAWIGESLLYVLRERLGLAGAKDGCSQGECGACNVQVDGRLVASCLVPAATTAGSEIRTVEGLAADGQPSDVQRALAACGAVQCGFCVPGMAMTVHDLLEGNPAPSELETRRALCGNLCRCSGYRGVLDAVQEVVAEREASAAAEASAPAPDERADGARIPHQAGPGAGGVHQSAYDDGTYGEPRGPYGQDGGQA
ncbi:2Fe-2S iron-sulfur cluster-binding protein [Streptomyces sp. NRRL S-920]|uniref:2Fe-2S iron-sulfur cluster-binding protein n=1 Tax=Streptomyces sp. NRRL S-920 TaxID=1463921 RepID=UPI0004C875BD|nr:2Fe-2S iron-sulfur cluster-binding protein [Streptomyces sp. NRRL S-920]